MTKRRVLLDTGPLIAILAEKDSLHRRCRDTLDLLTPPLLTCWPVLNEVLWLLRDQTDLLNTLSSGFKSGLFALLALDAGDLLAIANLMKRYDPSRMGFAVAALAHLAEREHIRTMFTTDRRAFSVIRLKGNRALRIIPEAQ